MNTQIQNSKPKYDLEDRTAKFGENIIDFARSVKPDYINKPIITQLIKSATSIGANYMEANGAESKKDFLHKINICKKEARETKHFLRMVATSNPEITEQFRILRKEAHELNLIFGAITRTPKGYQ